MFQSEQTSRARESGSLRASGLWRGSTALLDQLVVSATNFAVGVVVGRACSKDELGLYMLGISVLYFAIDSQTALISSPYMIFAPRLRWNDRIRYTGSAVVHQFLLTLFIVGALILAYESAEFFEWSAAALPVLPAVAASIGFVLFREFARRVSFANLDFKSALLLDCCVAALQLIFLALLVRLEVLSAVAAILAVGTSCLAGAALWIVKSKEHFRLNRSRIVPDFKQNWSFGKWIAASGVLWALSMNLYPWVLAAFHGTSSTGVWAACFGVVALGNPLFLGMQNFFGPRLAHSFAAGGAASLERTISRVSMVLGLFAAPFCVVLVLGGGSLVAILYGAKYAGNGAVVALLSINWLINAVAFSFSRGLFIIGRSDLEFRTNVVNLLTLLLVGTWLVRVFGPLGVALSLLTGNIIVSLLKFVLFRQRIRHFRAEEVRMWTLGCRPQ